MWISVLPAVGSSNYRFLWVPRPMDFHALSNRYLGTAARQYNAERESGPKWLAEQRVIQRLLERVAAPLRVVDVPVGTGRMFSFYKDRGFKATGIDVSPDMLEEARGRADELGLEVELRQGDIRSLPAESGSFGLAVCIRFLNWVDLDGVRSSLAELSRVSSDKLLVGIRHMTPAAEFRPVPRDAVRILRRLLGHAKARARKSGLVYHDKRQLYAIFDELSLEIVEAWRVETRSDGTDYNIYLMRKRGTAG